MKYWQTQLFKGRVYLTHSVSGSHSGELMVVGTRGRGSHAVSSQEAERDETRCTASGPSDEVYYPNPQKAVIHSQDGHSPLINTIDKLSRMYPGVCFHGETKPVMPTINRNRSSSHRPKNKIPPFLWNSCCWRDKMTEKIRYASAGHESTCLES